MLKSNQQRNLSPHKSKRKFIKKNLFQK